MRQNRVKIYENEQSNRKSRGPRSPQEARELNFPVINRLRNFRRQPLPQGGGDPGGGDAYSSWSEDEEYPQRNVTRTGGNFLATCHRFIPSSRRTHPISRFLYPRDQALQDESVSASRATLSHRSSEFSSGVAAQPSIHPQKNSSSPKISKRPSKVSELRRQPASLIYGQPPIPEASMAIQKTQSESVIPDERPSGSLPPLPYHYLPGQDSTHSRSVQKRNSLPNFPSSLNAQTSRAFSHTELPSGQSRKSNLGASEREDDTVMAPVPAPRKRKSSHLTTKMESLISSLNPTFQQRDPSLSPPTPKPRSKRSVLQHDSTEGSAISVLEVDRCSETDGQQAQDLIYYEVEPDTVIQDDIAAVESTPYLSSEPCPCDGFTSRIHRKPVRVRYREVQPRYIEEPLFWVKSKWAPDEIGQNEQRYQWPPNARTEPKPDFLLSNALRVVRQPKKVPIPKYQDSSTGKVTNWCTSGMARNYVYKPDFGKVPAYLHSQRKAPQEICQDEFCSIMNICHPRNIHASYFSKPEIFNEIN